VPFVTVELGADTDPFLLHLFAALAERIIGERLALAAAKARGVKLGGTNAQSIANRSVFDGDQGRGVFFGHFSRRVLGPPRESGRKRAMSDAGTVFIIFVGLAATVTMWCLGLLIANGFVLP
jgi:hypothetical protein